MNRNRPGHESTRHRLGRLGESYAARYLEARGYRIRERNYRIREGEIDLIAEDGEVLVFIEVKTRRSACYGMPQAAVDPRKQRQIGRVAMAYLQAHPELQRPCRFDVMALRRTRAGFQVEHIQNAFELRGELE